MSEYDERLPGLYRFLVEAIDTVAFKEAMLRYGWSHREVQLQVRGAKYVGLLSDELVKPDWALEYAYPDVNGTLWFVPNDRVDVLIVRIVLGERALVLMASQPISDSDLFDFSGLLFVFEESSNECFSFKKQQHQYLSPTGMDLYSLTDVLGGNIGTFLNDCFSNADEAREEVAFQEEPSIFFRNDGPKFIVRCSD